MNSKQSSRYVVVNVVLFLIVLTIIVVLWAMGVFSSTQLEHQSFTEQSLFKSQNNTEKKTTAPAALEKNREDIIKSNGKVDEQQAQKLDRQKPTPEMQVQNQPIALKPEEVNIRDAKILEAPDLNAPRLKDKTNSLDDFSERMRKFANDEFAFSDAKKQVFTATFDQSNITYYKLNEWTGGRNTIVFPPKYDFDKHQVTFVYHLWYEDQEIPRINPEVFTPYKDSCCLVATFDIDEATARQWRNTFDHGSLKMTIWFRFEDVDHASWVKGNNGLSLWHDVAFRVKVLHFQ